jgi:mannosyl-oligosaccharide alpha-1,3-glucosidase
LCRFYRGGHIIARRERPRRSTAAQRRDPYTLVAALNATQGASGHLYIDDGASFDFMQGTYLEAEFEYDKGVLQYQPMHAGMGSQATFERILVLGHKQASRKARYVAEHAESGASFEVLRGDAGAGGYDHSVLVVRNPQTPVAQAWTLNIRAA